MTPSSLCRSGHLTSNAVLPGSFIHSFARRCVHTVEDVAPSFPSPSFSSPFFSSTSHYKAVASSLGSGEPRRVITDTTGRAPSYVRHGRLASSLPSRACAKQGSGETSTEVDGYRSTSVLSLLSKDERATGRSHTDEGREKRSHEPTTEKNSSDDPKQDSQDSMDQDSHSSSRFHPPRFPFSSTGTTQAEGPLSREENTSTLIVTIHGMSPLPASKAIAHPFVRVWVVDALTGKNLLQPPLEREILRGGRSTTISGRGVSLRDSSSRSSSTASSGEAMNRKEERWTASSSRCGVTAPFDVRMRATRSPWWEAELRLPLVASLFTARRHEHPPHGHPSKSRESEGGEEAMRRSKMKKAKEEAEADAMRRAVVLLELCEAGNESAAGTYIPRNGVERIAWGYFMLFNPGVGEGEVGLQVPSRNIHIQLFPDFTPDNKMKFRTPWYVPLLQRYLPSSWSPSNAVFALTKAATSALWKPKSVQASSQSPQRGTSPSRMSWWKAKRSARMPSNSVTGTPVRASREAKEAWEVVAHTAEEMKAEGPASPWSSGEEEGDGGGGVTTAGTPLLFFIFQIPEARKIPFRGALVVSLGYEEEREEDNCMLTRWHTTPTALVQKSTPFIRKTTTGRKRKGAPQWWRLASYSTCTPISTSPPRSLLIYEAYLLQQLLAAGVGVYSPYPHLPVHHPGQEAMRSREREEADNAYQRELREQQQQMEAMWGRSIPAILREQRGRVFRRRPHERALLPQQYLGTYMVEGRVTCLSMSPSGRFFAVGVSHRFRYDVQVYDPLLPPSCMTAHLLTGEGEGEEEEMASLSNQPLVTLPGHTGHLHMLRFLPSDDRLLVSGGADMTVRVWLVEKKERGLDVSPEAPPRYRPPSPRVGQGKGVEYPSWEHTMGSTGTTTHSGTDPSLGSGVTGGGVGLGRTPKGVQDGPRDLYSPVAPLPSPSTPPRWYPDSPLPLTFPPTPGWAAGPGRMPSAPSSYASPSLSDPGCGLPIEEEKEPFGVPWPNGGTHRNMASMRSAKTSYYYSYRCLYVLPHSFSVYDAVFHEGHLLTCGCSPSLWTWKLRLPPLPKDTVRSLSATDAVSPRAPQKGHPSRSRVGPQDPPPSSSSPRTDDGRRRRRSEDGFSDAALFNEDRDGSFELVSTVSNEEKVVLFSLGNSTGRLHHPHHVWSVSSSGLITCWRAVEETYGECVELSRDVGEEGRGRTGTVCSGNASTAAPGSRGSFHSTVSSVDHSSAASDAPPHAHLDRTRRKGSRITDAVEDKGEGPTTGGGVSYSDGRRRSRRQENGTGGREPKHHQHRTRRVWEISVRRHVVCQGAVQVSVSGKYVLVTCMKAAPWWNGEVEGGGEDGLARGNLFHGVPPSSSLHHPASLLATGITPAASAMPAAGATSISITIFDDATGQLLWKIGEGKHPYATSISHSSSLWQSGVSSPLCVRHAALLPGGDAFVMGTRDGKFVAWESVDGGVATPPTGFEGMQMPHSIERFSWSTHRHLVACASAPFLSSSPFFSSMGEGEDGINEREGILFTDTKVRQMYTAISIGGTSVYSLPSSLRTILGPAFLPPARRILSSSSTAVQQFTEVCGGVFTERRRQALAMAKQKEQIRRRNISKNRRQRLYEGDANRKFRVPPLSSDLLDLFTVGVQNSEEEEDDEEGEEEEEDDDDDDNGEVEDMQNRTKRRRKRSGRKKKVNPLANELAAIQTSMFQQQQRLHFEEMKTLVDFWKDLTRMHRHHPPCGGKQ